MDVTRIGQVVTFGIDPGNDDVSVVVRHVGDCPVVMYFDCEHCGRVTDVIVLTEGMIVLKDGCRVCGWKDDDLRGWHAARMPEEGLIPAIDEHEI